MTEVFYREINPKLSLPEMEVLAGMLSPERRQRFYALRLLADRRRLITGDMLLRSALAEKLHCLPGEVAFKYSMYGKPYLTDANGIFFNLSHSGNYAVAVISTEETGIDIEEIRPLKEPLNVARVFMSDQEVLFFSNLPEEDRQSWFYRLWTAKESFIKNTGKGISEGLQSVTIDFSGKRTLVYKDKELLPGFYFHEIHVDPRYATCVCGSAEMPFSCNIY